MNKFIKEQLKKAKVTIRYPDGQEVDLDNVSGCEFVIERINMLGATTGRFSSIQPNVSNVPKSNNFIQPQYSQPVQLSTEAQRIAKQDQWPDIKIKRKN